MYNTQLLSNFLALESSVLRQHTNKSPKETQEFYIKQTVQQFNYGTGINLHTKITEILPTTCTMQMQLST